MVRSVFLVVVGVAAASDLLAAPPGDAAQLAFPPPLTGYGAAGSGVLDTLRHRATMEPFNMVATLIFFLAIIHTFLAAKFLHLAHRWQRGRNMTRRDDDRAL